MPYIKPIDRTRMDCWILPLSHKIETVGELNYAVTRLALRYLKLVGLSYNNISNVVGTLTLIPVEIGRRLVQQYEDAKIGENGDVPEFKPSYWTED